MTKPASPITRRARQVALEHLDQGKSAAEARELLRRAHYTPTLVQNAVAWAVAERARTST